MSQAAQAAQLPPRFAAVKQSLIEGKEECIVASWNRLLLELKSEIDAIRCASQDIIPSIDFRDLANDRVGGFPDALKTTGVGIVRGVVCEDVVLGWMSETRQYISHNQPRGVHNKDVFWSPAQIRARAHPNVLAAQRLLTKTWKTDESDAVTTNFTAAYADRAGTPLPEQAKGDAPSSAFMEGGGVDRWDHDGQASTYQEIWDGRWESYDPWAASRRLDITPDGYNNTRICSAVQLFQGSLCLESQDPGGRSMRICPMLRSATAYLLLRPFFAPMNSTPTHPNYLSPKNWALQHPVSSVLQGATLGSRQEVSDLLHPHLRLGETLVPLPSLQPGDYVILHPDAITSPSPSGAATTISLPICPLTRINALYLLRQRKAFLLGQSPPDFQHAGSDDDGKWAGRLGVQEVSDTGGEDALRAMGLAPWDEDDVEGVMEAEVLEEANNVLFPDRYDFDMDGA